MIGEGLAIHLYPHILRRAEITMISGRQRRFYRLEQYLRRDAPLSAKRLKGLHKLLSFINLLHLFSRFASASLNQDSYPPAFYISICKRT